MLGRIRRSRAGGSAREATGRDRISALSDDLLHRILGSLDARLAVGQCSLLSRRWRHLWASMPRVTLFGLVSERFGSNLFLLREEAKLCALSLHSSNDMNHFPHQRRWLRHVVSRGIRVLEITLVTGYPFELPDCVFNCATLEEMIVSQSTFPSVVREVVAPKSVCLPRLKKLQIHHIQLSDPSMSEKLNSGCPALEELDFSQCSLGVFKISSDTVNTLSVTACDYSEIHVSAPNVVSLKLSVAGRVKLDAMPSLLSAWVYVSRARVNPHAAERLDFLDALCNAQHLELFRFDLLFKDKPATEFCLSLPVNDMMDQPAPEGGPTFRKLKSLYLGEWLVADFYRPFAYFLNRAPSLATLSLDQWKLYEENNGMIPAQLCIREKPTEKLNLPSGLSSDLEVLHLRISKGEDAGEFSTLRRILKEKTKPRETEIVWF
ncbi:unnamed protein product [Alopecurus aequalis]